MIWLLSPTHCFGTPIQTGQGDKYVGEWKNDKQHGQGTATYSAPHKNAGDKYVGEYRDGKRNGQGNFTYANGDKYAGEYRDDKRNGQGTYIYPDGENYVGAWKDGKTTDKAPTPLQVEAKKLVNTEMAN